MGGSSYEVYNPTPPPAPTTSSSIQEWVGALPQIFAQQQAFAPQEAQQQLELLQQYGQPMAEAYKNAQSALYPETTALQEQMASQASTGMEQGLSDQEKALYRDQFAANLGTNAGSGIGADYMGSSMLQADLARKDYYRNLSLSLAGRQPLAQPSSPQTSNYMNQFTPGQVMGANAQNYSTYAQANRPFAQYQPGGVSLGLLGQWGGR